jgi:hypothetical protein
MASAIKLCICAESVIEMEICFKKKKMKKQPTQGMSMSSNRNKNDTPLVLMQAGSIFSK